MARCVIGVQPDNGKEGALPRVFCKSEFTTATYTRAGTEDFTVDVTGKISSWAGKDITVDHRWVLCQEGTIVKEFDPQDEITIKDGFLSDVSATLTFGASLADGEYELREMYRANSSDTWKYCDYYWQAQYILLVTIDGTTLTLKKSSDMDVKDIYKDISVKLEGAKKTQRGMTATLNWTNKGYDNVNTFYLWDGGEDPIAIVSSYLNHNQTEDLNIHFAPKKAGSITYKISTDYDKTNVIWTSEQTIEASLPHNLDGEIAIEGEKNNTIEGTTINATITLKNEGENAYNDQIIIELIPIDEQGHYVYDETKTIYKDVSLAAGAEKPLTVQFVDLTKGQRYEIDVRYYSYNETYDKIDRSYAAWTTCTVGTELVAYDMDVTMDVKNANSDNEIEGTTVKMDITIKNKGTNDYKDKILVEAWYAPGDGLIHWEKDQIIDVEVAAGQTKTLSNYEFSGLTIGTTYCFRISYYSENIEQTTKFWTYYTLIEPTAINEVKSDTSKKVGIYDLRGRQVKTPGKGVYIINGKQVIMK
jgi:hypothetical protein